MQTEQQVQGMWLFCLSFQWMLSFFAESAALL